MKFKKALKYVVFLLMISCLGFLYSFTSVRNLDKKIKDTPVEIIENGMEFISKKTVNNLLIQNGVSVKKKPKSIINLYGLENAILKNPYIEKSTVFLTIDGRLKTIVKQRKPIARIFTNKGSYYIDKKGVEVPLSSNFTARVLLVFGVKNETDLREINLLMGIILKDKFLQKEITSIVKMASGEYQFNVRSGSYKIVFGKLKNTKVKFNKLKVLYNQIFEDKTIQKYKTINLKYTNQVVCKKIIKYGK